MEDVKIRVATVDDAQDILNIYRYYILNTAITFECSVPTVESFRKRVERILEKYPYYVAICDKKIVGYTYAGAFSEREAYRFCAELSIYLDKKYKKRGIGKHLYQKLIGALKEKGIKNIYAKSAVPVEKEDEYLDFNSVNYHKHLGFKQVGKFTQCGYKFNRWYNIVVLEKVIREV